MPIDLVNEGLIVIAHLVLHRLRDCFLLSAGLLGHLFEQLLGESLLLEHEFLVAECHGLLELLGLLPEWHGLLSESESGIMSTLVIVCITGHPVPVSFTLRHAPKEALHFVLSVCKAKAFAIVSPPSLPLVGIVSLIDTKFCVSHRARLVARSVLQVVQGGLSSAGG